MPIMGYTPAELQRLSNAELNAIFIEDRTIAVPDGLFKGRFIRRLDTPGARLPLSRVLEFIGFELMPFGIDFRHRRWYFMASCLQAGRFEPSIQQSRWRDTEVVSLDYSVSHLPRFARNFLYDEVMPLSEDVLLGLGGINREVGMGDHFFFSLERIGKS